MTIMLIGLLASCGGTINDFKEYLDEKDPKKLNDKLKKDIEKAKETNRTFEDLRPVLRPLPKINLDKLKEANEKSSPFDISSLRAMISSGVMWSSEIKDGLLELHDMTLFDAMGSTEGGMGSSVSNRELPAKTAKFALNP